MKITQSLDLYGVHFVNLVCFEADYRLPTEMSNDACLAYVRSGTHEVYSPTQKLVAKGKESILMKCGNYIANFSRESSEIPFRNMVFHLHPASIKKVFEGKSLEFLSDYKEFKKGVNPALKLGQNELLDNFVNSLMIFFDQPQLANEQLLATKLQELIYILCNTGSSDVVKHILTSLYSEENIALERIIEANLYNNLTIAELAHLSAKSESTFKREFKKVYGESPAKYLKNKRIEKATQLLKSSTLSVSEVGWECGFENTAHFSTSFKAVHGVSPRAYKEMA